MLSSIGQLGLEWFALYTRHQHENAVARALSNRGIEAFLPRYNVVRRWKDRNKQLRLPLFPCYVFVHSSLDRKFDILSSAPGIVGLVGSEGRPSAIPGDEIESVRRAVESKFQVEPHPFLICGDRVRVKFGPMEGAEGILVRKKNLFRLVVSVEILGRSAAVEIDGAAVERVPMNNLPVLSLRHHEDSLSVAQADSPLSRSRSGAFL
jgi:transcription antitermination factor NusG